MGASGVGKTTLLKVLSGQDDTQSTVARGNVMVNSHITTHAQRLSGSLIGHIEQYEIFLEIMLLEEHLIFHVCSFIYYF